MFLLAIIFFFFILWEGIDYPKILSFFKLWKLPRFKSIKLHLPVSSLCVCNPDILILDEATSSIDSYSEDLIKKATKTITKDKTSIIIAHRLSTVESADKIIYMENGKILEFGNHKELLNIDNGKFKKLYREQFIENELV